MPDRAFNDDGVRQAWERFEAGLDEFEGSEPPAERDQRRLRGTEVVGRFERGGRDWA
jgi:hypothetical protein